MGGRIRSLVAQGVGQFADDLRTDPYLKFILLAATVLSGFWFWHRIPNFATRDEHSRLMDSLVAYGHVISEPSYESLREGVVWGRVPFGATFYLFGLAVLPVAIVAFLTGQLDLFEAFVRPSWEFGFYPSWEATPRWVWTWSLGLVRLFNVLFAVGCVYLTYRLGVATYGRTAGRLSAVLLTVTFGFLTIAHEGGEDMPALFFVLLALYLVLRYVQTGDGALFLAGSLFGGVAIAFKLTAAPIILLIGVGHFLRARNAGDDWTEALFAPALLGSGALLGFAAIVLGFPTALVGEFDLLWGRIFGGSASRMSHPTGPDAPIWWWFLRQYFTGLSLPLFAAAVTGVVASAAHLRRRGPDFDGTALVLVALVANVVMFSQWHDFRVHHLLPTFPLLALLLGGTLARLRDRRPSIGGPVIALLVVTSGIYAGVGVAGFASMPRDEAESWLTENAADNATMELYRVNMQDTAIPHGMAVSHPYGEETLDPCPEYIQLGYRDLLYLKNDTYYRNGDVQAAYIRSLLEEERNYEIAAEFGPRPPNFVPQRPTPGSVTDLLGHGITPHVDQFADEQELTPNQYTVILERTGDCRQPRRVPF
ncbi:ArnT family glycosyltransferase [Halorientalis salina]|uniref:ArnT family glycosyltransferase n=1 Tax=Halorientalis salina TaxID=2932266 RepID=UPI0010AC404D|nr:glycosyltransferase family 39 protein [Halorientalis salina]